jgi:hypothetical protein
MRQVHALLVFLIGALFGTLLTALAFMLHAVTIPPEAKTQTSFNRVRLAAQHLVDSGKAPSSIDDLVGAEHPQLRSATLDDAWGTPVRIEFESFTERVILLVRYQSAGRDQRFGTADDIRLTESIERSPLSSK